MTMDWLNQYIYLSVVQYVHYFLTAINVVNVNILFPLFDPWPGVLLYKQGFCF